MRVLLIIAVTFLVTSCVQRNPDIIYPAPVAEVERTILPPDMETAAGNEDQETEQ